MQIPKNKSEEGDETTVCRVHSHPNEMTRNNVVSRKGQRRGNKNIT
jgi:hypothetical protein